MPAAPRPAGRGSAPRAPAGSRGRPGRAAPARRSAGPPRSPPRAARQTRRRAGGCAATEAAWPSPPAGFRRSRASCSVSVRRQQFLTCGRKTRPARGANPPMPTSSRPLTPVPDRGPDLGAAAAAAGRLREALGVDTSAEGVAETPARMARTYAELLTPVPFSATTSPNDEGYDELVVAT